MNPVFEWSKNFEIGITAIDEQHRGLVGIINELVENILKGESAGQAACARLLGDLVTYADVHFRTEETLMEKMHYSGLTKHREQHSVFAKRFQDMKALADASRELPDVETAYFLIDWVNHHILREDKKMGLSLKELGC